MSVARPHAQTKKGQTAYQHVDPSGKTMIEMALMYQEPEPKKPPPKKVRLNKPLPYRTSSGPATGTKHNKESSAGPTAIQKLMLDAQRDAKREQNTPVRPAARRKQPEWIAPLIPDPEAPSSKIGTMRFLKEDEDASPPFSRDMPMVAHAHRMVNPIGTNPQPKDGLKKMPVVPDYDPDTDAVFGNKLHQKVSQPLTAEDLEDLDIMGRPKLKPQAKKSAVDREIELIAEEENLKRQNDHFSKVMSRTRLVEQIQKEKAQFAVSQANKGQNVEYDLLGRPITTTKLVETMQQNKNPCRKNMFAGDKEPYRPFGGEPLQPKAVQGKEIHDPNRKQFPGYIGNPTDDDIPEVLDGERGTSTSTKTPHGSQFVAPYVTDEQEEINEKAHLKRMTMIESFLASTVYQRILAGSKWRGVRKFRHALREFDKDGDAILTQVELKNACVKYGLDFSKVELVAIMRLSPPAGCEADPPPKVFIPGLLDVLRKGDLPLNRKTLIKDCFTMACKMLRKQQGLQQHILLSELESVMDFSAHPSFEAHVKGSMRTVVSAFYDAWGNLKQRNSQIGLEEFTVYFHDMSAGISRDQEFLRVMKGMFKIR